MIKNKAQLLIEAARIKDETVKKANTAVRVGTMLENIIDSTFVTPVVNSIRALNDSSLEILVGSVWLPYQPPPHISSFKMLFIRDVDFATAIPARGDYWLLSTHGDSTLPTTPINLTTNPDITDVKMFNGVSYSTLSNLFATTTQDTASSIFLVVPDMYFGGVTFINSPPKFHLQEIGTRSFRV